MGIRGDNLAKKVLFMVSTLTGGGAERTVSNLSQYFPNDYELDVLVNCKTENDYPFKGNIISLGMDYRVNKSTWYQIRAFVKRMKKLKEMRKHNHYDAVLSLIDSSSVANILTRKYGGKTIVSVRCVMSTNDTFQYKYIVNPLVRVLYNKADKVVALSKGVEYDLRENFAIKPELLTTIYNGYDISRAAEGVTKKENDVFTFISMGRLETQKGHWHLIRAFNELVKRKKDARLVILGQGSQKEYLEKLIDGYHLEGKVILKGFVKNTAEELRNADCFVFPSLFEGFGNALIEGLMAGLPVIASDFRYGAREILSDSLDIHDEIKEGILKADYGLITPVCSYNKPGCEEPLEREEECLLDALEMMMADESLRENYKKTARDCVKKFDMNETVLQWINYIEE